LGDLCQHALDVAELQRAQRPAAEEWLDVLLDAGGVASQGRCLEALPAAA